MLVAWIAIPLLAVLVLGLVAYGVFGALQRLGREAAGLQQDVAPLLARVQGAQATANRLGSGEPRANSR